MMNRALAVASLVMKPEGYNDGSLPSLIPRDRSGDFTFTRGSNLAATRVNQAGLIEKGRENFVLNSVWDGVGTGVAPTSWYTYDPNFQAGSETGQIRFTISGNRGYLFRDISLSVGVYAFSFYCDSVTTACQLESTIVVYGSATKTTIGIFKNGVAVNSADAIEAGNRYAFVFNVTGAGTGAFRIGAGVNNIDTADITLSRPQIEQGLIATDYIPTTTTTAQAGILENTPRLDYSGGATEPSLLLEPSRSNIFAYSEGMFDSSYFHQILAISVEGQQTDLNGTNTAVKLSNFVQSSSRLDYNTTVAAVDGKTYTYSAYYKGSGSININVSTSTGVGGYTEKTITLTDEWVRHSVTTTFSSPSGNVKSHLVITRTPNNDAEVYLCFAQIEEGSYPTSYIPTYGTSVTRAKDDCLNSSVSTSTDFTIFFEAKDFCLINGSIGGVFAGVQFVFSTALGTYNSAGSYHIYNNSLYYYNGTTNTGFGGIYNNQTDSKFALVKRGNKGIIYANGVKKTEITLPSGADAKVINWDVINLTSSLQDGEGDVFGSKYQQLLKFDTALSDAELTALTTI